MIQYLLIIVLVLAYWKLKRHYSYWSDRNVKQKKQIYLFGDQAPLFFKRKSFFQWAEDLYRYYPKERYFGIYQGMIPTLVLNDPELIKLVTVKEFDHFLNHRPFVPEGVDEIWGKNLVSLNDQKWRNMRSTLSPSFTSSKMKIIFSLMSECAQNYVEYFSKENGTIEIEMKDTTTRYTNDVIATAAFGITCDSINEKNNEFFVKGRQIATIDFPKSLRFFMNVIAPQFCKLFRIGLFSKEVTDFFVNLIKETIRIRETYGIVRPDMMHQLLQARKGKNEEESSNGTVVDTGFATAQESSVHTENKLSTQKLLDIDIAAQAMIFFFGGFDTVSTLMYFTCYELAKNVDIQRRLQKEIDDTLVECEGNLTYEALMKMKYMDMVICESLRLWPPMVLVDRLCTKPFTIKPVKPSEQPLDLKPGNVVLIPIAGLHHDPQYFPNPNVFDPERFNEENSKNITPYTYLPFGMGPRNCIGSRFAILETKTLIFHLLSQFNIATTKRTQIPIVLSKKVLNIVGESGLWLGLEPR